MRMTNSRSRIRWNRQSKITQTNKSWTQRTRTETTNIHLSFAIVSCAKVRQHYAVRLHDERFCTWPNKMQNDIFFCSVKLTLRHSIVCWISSFGSGDTIKRLWSYRSNELTSTSDFVCGWICAIQKKTSSAW